MLRVIVLGAAAGGGVPQWNCGCDNCNAARGLFPSMRSTQASLAISADDQHWFLVNASPDIRQQIIATPRLHPKPGALRHSPITGVILTNGEVDAVAGLLSLREGSPFTIFAHERVLSILKANSIFNVLGAKVRRQTIAIDHAFMPALADGSTSGLEVLPFAVPGQGAWYLEGTADGADADGDTLGLRITDTASGRFIYVLTACARVTPDLKARLTDARLVFFDGTVWRDDELITQGLGQKTGQRMGHIAMSGADGAIAALAGLGIGQKVFLHINNSNPAWRAGSPQRCEAEQSGWRIAADGMEFSL
ncbi:MAG: pyrroloquinoline quinone biosynthesis protein PqqB [Tardiphaga sp.]|nr:pyrroloquinoline quinone biosynthesis protein PqqB [Tardiphaga sp.]